MVRKITFLMLACLISMSIKAQQWVSFSSTAGQSAPAVNVLSSTAQSVSFEVIIPGIYTLDTIVNGVSFTRLILPPIHELILDNLPHHNAVFRLYPHKIQSS